MSVTSGMIASSTAAGAARATAAHVQRRDVDSCYSARTAASTGQTGNFFVAFVLVLSRSQKAIRSVWSGCVVALGAHAGRRRRWS